MRLFNLTHNEENTIIRLGIILFWWVFWLFNVIDKFISQGAPFWVGKDRYTQFINYFSSIGIENVQVPLIFLVFVTIIEIIAFLFFTSALKFHTARNTKLAHNAVFLGILASLFTFSFFAIGDQIFGDRIELLEHSIYWILLVLSWFVYTRAERS